MERNRVFAMEGLDGTGKTTSSRMLAEETNGHYFYWADKNVFKSFRKRFDSSSPKLRFLYYTAASIDTHFRINELRETADVFVDRTIASTIAYHKALGVPDSWISMIPNFLINQFDSMIYFTAEESTRIQRMEERAKKEGKLSKADEKSILIGRDVDRFYRTLMPEKTLIVSTDHKTPRQVVDEVKMKLYE